eukprot:TRINITY_DN11284_c0_g1_i10.p1 TRINITY_DN11284_c0_g1~~TRINITY_DN11284_c0_g1_i10.p1  ORF type:complete len:101 (+),score=4.49 TRINITY_DN11284_c0_g1_i10:433-735(+)
MVQMGGIDGSCIYKGSLVLYVVHDSENYLSHARGLDYNLGYCAQVTGCPIPNLYNSCTVQMKKLRIFIFSSIMVGSEAKMLGVVDSECVFHVRCCYTWEC